MDTFKTKALRYGGMIAEGVLIGAFIMGVSVLAVCITTPG
jgi:hypothetical protein